MYNLLILFIRVIAYYEFLVLMSVLLSYFYLIWLLINLPPPGMSTKTAHMR